MSIVMRLLQARGQPCLIHGGHETPKAVLAPRRLIILDEDNLGRPIGTGDEGGGLRWIRLAV